MTFYEAHREAASRLSVDGDRTYRIDLPNGGYVVASLYDDKEEARDAAGRDMLGLIERKYKAERAS